MRRLADRPTDHGPDAPLATNAAMTPPRVKANQRPMAKGASSTRLTTGIIPRQGRSHGAVSSLAPDDHPRSSRRGSVKVGDEIAVDAHPARGETLLDPLGRQAGGEQAIEDP